MFVLIVGVNSAQGMFHTTTTTKTDGSCFKTKKKVIFLLISGVLLIVLGTVSLCKAVAWIHSIIDSKLVIKPSSPIYQQWRSPTVPVLMQFYVFNVENPMEMKQSNRPCVSQKGPYSYRVYQTKENITWNKNSTVSYNKFTKYVFDVDSSCSSCNPHTDNVTLPNIPLVILSQVSKKYPGASLIFSMIFARFKEEFFRVNTVEELLWGYKDPVFEFFANLKRKFRLSFLPDIDPIFRMMENNTYDGVTTTYTGASDISRAAVWTRWKGRSDVGLWKSRWANMFNGSDGMQFPPQTSTGDILYTFYVQLCRSMSLVFDSHTNIDSVKTLRFTNPEELWQNASVNPANKGFCPNGCFPSGILDASVCKGPSAGSVPAIVASQPHFYQGDPSLVKNVEGLNPVKEEHGTFFDIEPNFGLPLHLSLRLQLNLNIEHVKFLVQMAGVKEVILPIMYFNNTVKVDASSANKMKSVLIAMRAVPFVSVALICIGSIEVVVAICCIVSKKWKYNKHAIRGLSSLNSETEPLVTSRR